MGRGPECLARVPSLPPPLLSWKDRPLWRGVGRPLIKFGHQRGTKRISEGNFHRRQFHNRLARDLIELAVTVTMSIEVAQDPLTQRGAGRPFKSRTATV